MNITKIKEKGIIIPAKDIQPIGANHGGMRFWSPEFQNNILFDNTGLEQYLPRVKECDEHGVLTNNKVPEYYIFSCKLEDKVELMSRSSFLEKGQLSTSQLDEFLECWNKFKQKANDPKVNKTFQDMINALELPDPKSDPNLWYMARSSFFASATIMVLWGGIDRNSSGHVYKSEWKDSLATLQGSKLSFNRFLRWLLLLILILLLLLAGYWLYTKKNDENNPNKTEQPTLNKDDGSTKRPQIKYNDVPKSNKKNPTKSSNRAKEKESTEAGAKTNETQRDKPNTEGGNDNSGDHRTSEIETNETQRDKPNKGGENDNSGDHRTSETVKKTMEGHQDNEGNSNVNDGKSEHTITDEKRRKSEVDNHKQSTGEDTNSKAESSTNGNQPKEVKPNRPNKVYPISSTEPYIFSLAMPSQKEPNKDGMIPVKFKINVRPTCDFKVTHWTIDGAIVNETTKELDQVLKAGRHNVRVNYQYKKRNGKWCHGSSEGTVDVKVDTEIHMDVRVKGGKATFEPNLESKKNVKEEGKSGAYQTPQQLLKSTRSSIVMIVATNDENFISRGSGFAVSKDGYILTNRHVVDGMSEIFTVINNSLVVARLVKKSTTHDLALLKVNHKFTNPLKLAKSKAETGIKVCAIGFPASVAERHDKKWPSPTISDGIVKNNDRVVGKDLCLETGVTINPGNSGGPLLDLTGTVVGINTWSAQKEENVFLAIHASEVVKIFPILKK